MKATVVHAFGEPEVMRLEEVATPEPAENQILVKIEAAGVNPVDTYLRSGNHAHAPKLPYTPGKDGSGVVEKVGDAVTKFKVGDRVYTANTLTGTYAEYALCSESHLGRLPDNVSFAQGAGVWTPYATAYRALFQKAGATSGETVLIHGASGGVGIAAVQWAKSRGLTVIGTASSEEGKKLVLNNGADAVFDHTDAEHFGAVRDFVAADKSVRPPRGGVDVIIEMLANVNLERDFECLAMFGRIVVVGNRGSIDFTPRNAMTKDATIFGMSLFNAPPDAMAEIQEEIFNGLSAGCLQPFVSRSYPLSDAPKSHREVIEAKASGKIILIP